MAARPTAQPAESGKIEEIIVTAQRRSENLQRVPMAISAVTATVAQQMGLSGSLNLSIASPGLTYNQTAGGGAVITLRGAVGTGTVIDESPTSIYIDGQYLAATPGLYFALNNIERIEVLKGPQGTLFGRNSFGGSIQIITKTPTFDTHVTTSLGYGSYNTLDAQFYGTTGLTSTLAMDVAALYSHQATGWGHNLNTGDDIYRERQIAIRSKILWAPDPDTKVVLVGAFNRTELPQLQGRTPYEGRLDYSGRSGTSIGFYNTNENYDTTAHTKQLTASLNASHDFGPVTLVNIAGYENTRTFSRFDSDNSSINATDAINPIKVKAETEEVHLLSSRPSWFQWIVGGFYFHSRIDYYFQSLTQPAGNRALYSIVDTSGPNKSYAAFGQATIEFLPRAKLTAGIRYTDDKHGLGGATGNQTATTALPDGSLHNTGTNYHLALSYQLNPGTLLYISNSTGFKSGLFSYSAPTTAPAQAARVKAYEIGAKTELFDRALRINVSAFQNDYTNVQVNSRNATNTGAVFSNAATARARGGDIDFTLLVGRALSFHGGASYLHSRYQSYPRAVFTTPNANGIGNVLSVGDASGNKTIQSPTFVITIAAAYKIESSIGDFTIAVSDTHNSGYYFEPQNRLHNPAYDLLNPSVEWRYSKTLSARLWMKNALKEEYYTSYQAVNFGDLMNVGDPRTYGITLRAEF